MYGGFSGTETNRNQRNWFKYVTYLSCDIDEDDTSSGNCYHVVWGGFRAILDGFVITGGYAFSTSKSTSNHLSVSLLTSGYSDATGFNTIF